MTNAKPAKLTSGAWGCRTSTQVQAGDRVQITTAAGKSWAAVVSRVLWTDGAACLCATSVQSDAAPRMGSYRTARQRATGWTGCSCGSIEGEPRRSDCASCQHDY